MKKATLVGMALASALLATPALAQQKGRAAPKPPEPPPPPAVFPCRSAEEVCYLGVVLNGQVVVIYTNATNADGIEDQPADVTGPNGAKLDLSGNNGRVVMLTGAFDPKTGISKAELVEVASPLVSLNIKAQLAGAPPEPPPPARGAPPAKRR